MASEKCCFCLKLDIGFLLLGVATIVASMIEIITTAVFVLPAHAETFQSTPSPKATVSYSTHHHVKGFLALVSDKSANTVLVSFIFIMCLLWMAISVLLIIGIVKKKASFVMTYFLFGITMSIIHLLFGLLWVISEFWNTSLITFILTLAYIKCLTYVYAAYDNMQQLNTVDDMDQLITDDDPTIEC